MLGEPITAHGSYVIRRISDVPYVYYMGRAKCAHGVLMESRIVCTTQSWTAKQDAFVTRLICTYVRVLLRFVGLAIMRAYIWQYCAYVIRVHWMPWTRTP
jgi:hypothetical protein